MGPYRCCWSLGQWSCFPPFSPPMIRAVFFDLYYTLARWWPPREELQATACQEFGIQVNAEGITRGYAAADAMMAHQNATRPLRTMSREERREFMAEYERLVLEGCGIQVSQELAGRIFARLRQIPYDLALFDDVLPILELLRQQELTLGLISNMNRHGAAVLERLGLTPYLSFVVTSEEVAAEKPHAPIFRAALERAEVEPHQTLHVGDQYESDVMGARGVGIHPVLLDRDGLQTHYNDVRRISTLTELPGVLAELQE